MKILFKVTNDSIEYGEYESAINEFAKEITNKEDYENALRQEIAIYREDDKVFFVINLESELISELISNNENEENDSKFTVTLNEKTVD